MEVNKVDMVVYVINNNGNPLMPCLPCKARHLLNQGKATVCNYRKFAIKLNIGVTEYKQDITLGIDAGYSVVGLSASTEDKVLYESNHTLRKDIVMLLAARRSIRRSRRNRKTRYRQARFLNRVHTKHKGWLSPATKARVLEHLNVVQEAHKLLPINHIVCELASFDIQKIKNPDIQGDEYQKGDQLGFENAKAYVRWRDGNKCDHCKGKSKDSRLEVHHIKQRKDGGSNSPDNLITLCHTCHQDLHNGKFEIKKPKSYKAEAFMGIMRWALYNELKAIYSNVDLTYGYITKQTRIENNLTKDHYIDARCIAGHPKAKSDGTLYYTSKPRSHNRQLHKCTINKGGVRKGNQSPRKVFGYALNDIVDYNGEECIIHGRRSSGSFDIRKPNGEVVNKGLSYKKLKLIDHAKAYIIYKGEGGNSSHQLKIGGYPCPNYYEMESK